MTADSKTREPEALQQRPHHGSLPIPYTTHIVDGVPDFRINDQEHVLEALRARLCALCGKRLATSVVFVGGDRSRASHLFTDPPSHERCARFAAAICPFLVGKRTDYRTGGLESAREITENESVYPQRPAHMYLLWTRAYAPVQAPDGSLAIRAGTWEREQEIGRSTGLPAKE